MAGYDGYTDARREANKKYRQSGALHGVRLDLTQADADAWQAYADSIGIKRATMIRQCVRRCMIADGWTGADAPAPDEHAPRAPVLVEPIKRKPGRPRKVQPETDAQQQPKRGRGRPRKTAPTE